MRPTLAGAAPDETSFTLDDLAAALRGMPRDARIMVELPSGERRNIVTIIPIPSAPGHQGHMQGSAGYTIVLRAAGLPPPEASDTGGDVSDTRAPRSDAAADGAT